MLGALKGIDGMQELTNVYKEYSIMRGLVKFAFSISPLYSTMVETAAKHNPVVRVVLKAALGKVPDIEDIYDLATNSRKKSMLTDIIQIQMNNRKYRQFLSLMENNSTKGSAIDLNEFIKIGTGRDVALSQKLVTDVNNGEVKLTKQNLADVNLVNVFLFFLDNYRLLNTTTAMLVNGQQTSIYRSALQLVGKLDISRLEKIRSINSALINDKYKVTSGEGFLTDSRVVSITQDVDQARKFLKGRTLDNGKVLTLFLDLEKQLISLFTDVIQEAPLSANNNNTQSQTALG